MDPSSDRLPDSASLQALLDQVLDRARAGGASAAEAQISRSRGLSLSIREGAVESLEFQSDRDLSVTVYRGQRRGSATTADFSPGGLAEAVRAALTIATHTEEDPCAGLAPAARMARVFPPLDLDHPWDLSPEQAMDLARASEAAALAHDPRIRHSEGASLSSHRGVSAYANSHGFFGHRRGTQHSLSVAVIAEDGQGMQRDYWWDGGRDPARLARPEAIGQRAAERAVARLSPRRLSTRESPVLFPPELARGLFGSFLNAIAGSALYRRASFLLDALGQPVFPAFLDLVQEPHLPGAMASSAYDQEGVATERRQLVEAGVLKGWLLSSYSARKLGLETTGNAGGVYNLVVSPGRLDLDGLLAEMGEGLLVTELLGSGVNGVTGDYSRGAAGFWVEGGAIAYPVEGLTIAGNLRAMFAGIRAHGADVDARAGTRCGSLLLDRMTVAGD
ncbi:MAG TPA: metalloprotease PmbA [Nevskiaceae bacterium]|nr:metalloprotease PmbA [Nevskiaceae bacterium]